MNTSCSLIRSSNFILPVVFCSCMKDIKGDNHNGYCQSSKQCVLNDNGLPEPGCKFCVDERRNTARGSIMGKPEISSVGKPFTRVYK